jgi:imidazole glycerol-phosphate synthase subunit HisF
MFRPRVIPVLLLEGNGLVKSVRFKNHRYIGDPINAVHLFNELKADELIFLDIQATREHRTISLDFVKNVGEEANMPFAVGGGISTIRQIKDILRAGAEKVVISTEAIIHPDFIRQAAETFGTSTIAVCMDVRRIRFGKEQTTIVNGTKATGILPSEFGQMMEERGAGELIVQSIENDGMMTGYDIGLIRKVSEAVTIPVVALGGAGTLPDLREAVTEGYASALAAGSMFVFHGPRKAVLVNYPSREQLAAIFLLCR